MKLQKYAKYLGAITLAVVLATGCSNTGTSTDKMANNNEQAVQQIISDAKGALADAEKGGYAWRDTGKFIKQAEKALADGNIAKASSLAMKALEQSELAEKQNAEQDRAVKERFSKS